MKNKKTIYIFGNPLLNFDNTPFKVLPDLKKELPYINFITRDPNENLKPDKDGELIIIDTIMDIKDVIAINDINKIKNSPRYSMHDFDLGFNLKLLEKIGKLKKITIFGVPAKIKKRVAIKQLVNAIKKEKLVKPS